MAGGLLNLVNCGQENVIINGNPSKTFWKSTYNKYTNFGMQKFRLDYEGQKQLELNTSSKFTFKVKRYADLLWDTYLVINLPDIYSPFYEKTYYSGISNASSLDIDNPPLVFTSTNGNHIFSSFNLKFSSIKNTKSYFSSGEFINNLNNSNNIDALGYSALKYPKTDVYFKDISTYIINFFLKNKLLTYPFKTLTQQFPSDQLNSIIQKKYIPYEFKWIEKLGFNIIKEISIEVGGQKLQHFSGDYIQSKISRDFTGDKNLLINKMIGNTNEFVNPAYAFGRNGNYPSCIADSSPEGCSPSIRGRKLYIPLTTWFSINSQLAFPLVALQYNELVINITLRPVSELFRIRAVESPENNFAYKAPNFNLSNEKMHLFLQKPMAENGDPKFISNSTKNDSYDPTIDKWNADIHLISTYVFLSEDEQQVFATKEQEYLIDYIYENTFKSVNSSNVLELGSLGLVTSWMWFARRDDVYLRNEWSNYSNWEYNNIMPNPGYTIPSINSTVLNTQVDNDDDNFNYLKNSRSFFQQNIKNIHALKNYENITLNITDPKFIHPPSIEQIIIDYIINNNIIDKTGSISLVSKTNLEEFCSKLAPVWKQQGQGELNSILFESLLALLYSNTIKSNNLYYDNTGKITKSDFTSVTTHNLNFFAKAEIILKNIGTYLSQYTQMISPRKEHDNSDIPNCKNQVGSETNYLLNTINYDEQDQITAVSEVVNICCTALSSSSLFNNYWGPGTYQSYNFSCSGPNTESNNKEILTNVAFSVDGTYREYMFDSGIYNYIEKYNRTLGNAKDGLYCYNFKINTNPFASYQPSGAMNFNKYTHTNLELVTIQPPLQDVPTFKIICDNENKEPIAVYKGTNDIFKYNYDIIFFEERLNIVKFIGGNVGLVFAN